jgi:hypothetical protein
VRAGPQLRARRAARHTAQCNAAALKLMTARSGSARPDQLWGVRRMVVRGRMRQAAADSGRAARIAATIRSMRPRSDDAVDAHDAGHRGDTGAINIPEAESGNDVACSGRQPGARSCRAS